MVCPNDVPAVRFFEKLCREPALNGSGGGFAPFVCSAATSCWSPPFYTDPYLCLKIIILLAMASNLLAMASNL